MQASRLQDMRIDDVGISILLWRKLKRAGINFYGQLLEETPPLTDEERLELHGAVIEAERRLRDRDFLSEQVQKRRESISSRKAGRKRKEESDA